MRQRVRNVSNRSAVLALVAGLIAASALAFADRSARRPPALRPAAAASRLALHSPDVTPGDTIALGHVYDASGCHGGNISPALSWTHPPAGTRSFAVLMFDPDAPGGGWWHWAAFDIPAGVTSLQAGAGNPGRHLLPAGAIQARNDFGSPGYGGPCPPPGPPHHYHLMLYALRVARLGLDAGASAAQVAAKARSDALAEGQIVGTYGR
ncbi:MAG TPA: YbhB/YbcL family Raf kinase inhibitor-like protein [Steroidobacteraceae bacterium]|nr:YbhB/YbcL family Raf kinase inhibitor-like protein [Steroidobacteraceae bacterium]